MKSYCITNVSAVLEKGIINNASFRFSDGRIIGFQKPQKTDTIIDGEGLYLAPGFIDLHVHGGAGSDFMDGTKDDFNAITSYHAAGGTTSLLATTLTSSDDELFNALECYNRVVGAPYEGARLLGLHLEGPYFSHEQRGAQDPRFLRAPTPSHYKEIFARSKHIKRWSAAPELAGDEELCAYAKSRGVVMSIGHSSCTAAQAKQAAQRGYSLITHLYSGMNSVKRVDCFRVAGLVEAGLLYDELCVELIADGKHLPPELIQLAYKVKGAGAVALITDCSSAAGTTGNAKIGSRKAGQPVVIENGVAYLTDRSGFAGSIATTERLLSFTAGEAKIPLCDVVTSLTLTPASLLGISHKKGTLKAGADADLVLFSFDGERADVRQVFIDGKPFKGVN